MVKKFMHIEDNGDETITCTMNLTGEEGEEVTIVLPFSIEGLKDLIPVDAQTETIERVTQQVVVIPNHVDGAEE